jgi:endonuclease YncB( thermonuclease family)
MSDPVIERMKRWVYRMSVLKRLLPGFLMLSGLYWVKAHLWHKPQAQPVQNAELLTWQRPHPQPDPLKHHSQTGTIVAVPTADSVTVLVGKQQVRLRLCGIDAPELTQPEGKPAQAFLQQLMGQGQQQVQFIPVRQQSAYLIAEVFSGSTPSPRFVNQELVQAGVAYVYRPYVAECPHQEAIVQAEALARQRGEPPTGILPWEYRRQQVAQHLFQPSAAATPKLPPDYLRDGMQQTLLGLASWYGPKLHGNLTASGETFNQNALTAAHHSLPFDTRLQITNLQNGKTVIVRINDYHPALDNSSIDLSQAAARQIDAIDAGIVPVEMEILEGR